MRQATIQFTSNKVEQPDVYDHEYYENEIAEVCEFGIFGPTYRIDGKPASDLRGLSMHLSKIVLGKKIKFINEINYAFVKWPAQKPGLLFGYVPLEVWDHPLQTYTDPRTNKIPNERPAWGSFQFVQAPWHNEPIYCLLITEGPMDRLQLIITNILKRYYKYGQQIFERESSHCLFHVFNNCSAKRKFERCGSSNDNANQDLKRIKLD